MIMWSSRGLNTTRSGFQLFRPQSFHWLSDAYCTQKCQEPSRSGSKLIVWLYVTSESQGAQVFASLPVNKTLFFSNISFVWDTSKRVNNIFTRKKINKKSCFETWMWINQFLLLLNVQKLYTQFHYFLHKPNWLCSYFSPTLSGSDKYYPS